MLFGTPDFCWFYVKEVGLFCGVGGDMSKAYNVYYV